MPEALFDFTGDRSEDGDRQPSAGEDKGRLAEVVPLGAAAAAETQPALFEPANPNHREKFDRLRQSAAYRRRLESIRTAFDFERLESGMRLCARDIPAPDPRRLEQWLAACAGYLEPSAGRFHEIDRAIFRVELRRLVTRLNKGFAGRIGELFPDRLDFQIERLNYRQKQARGRRNWRPNGRRQMVYENTRPIVILNSIGCNALFGASSYDVRDALLQKNINEEESPSRRSLNLGRTRETSLYDFLPGQFLLARAWAVRSLGDFIDLRIAEDYFAGPGFSEAAECFQSLNLEAWRLLHRGGGLDAALEREDLPGSVRPVRETERLLLAADWPDCGI